jgi:PAS domain S-box-containing protein
MSARSQSDLLQSLVEALPFGVYVLDAQGRIVVWNQAVERITGYLAQTMVGRLLDQDLLVCSEIESTSRRSAIPHNGGELFFRHAEGHRVPVLARSFILRDSEGAVIGNAKLFGDESTGNETLCWMNAAEIRLDPDLGIPCESASEEQLRVSLTQDDDIAVFRVRLKGLDDYARRCGSEMVHVTLRTLAQTISHMLVVPHYFGSWRNHQFLVLVPECDQETMERVLEKLKNAGKACRITWWGDRVIPDLEVVAFLVPPGETTEAVFARLEEEEEGRPGAGEKNECL